MAEKSEKVVWVTGAGSGIGEAAALALGAEGTTMVLTGRRIGPLEKVAAAITAVGGTAHVQSGDLTNSADVGRVEFAGKARLDRCPEDRAVRAHSCR